MRLAHSADLRSRLRHVSTAWNVAVLNVRSVDWCVTSERCQQMTFRVPMTELGGKMVWTTTPAGQKKEPSPRFAARRTLFHVWYHARWRTINTGQSHPRLSATFALRWLCIIAHDITLGTAFFWPRISGMVLFFFVQGSMMYSHREYWPERFKSNNGAPLVYFVTSSLTQQTESHKSKRVCLLCSTALPRFVHRV